MAAREHCRLAGAILALAALAGAGRAADAPKGERYALLVGVQKYSEEKILRPLPYSERDVTDLAAVLRDNGYKADNVVLMTQAAASDDLRYLPMKKRILAELRLLLADRSADDTVLVAFAGHGVHFGDDKNSYFCPADALLEDRSTLIPLADVYAVLEKCRAGVKVLLVDACRNDPFKDPTRAAKADLDSVTRPEAPDPPNGVAAFFSCSVKEKAYEDEKLGHGVFFHFVIQGMSGAAASDDGAVTLLGLSEYVTRKVSDRVRAEFGKTQLPELVGRTSGAAALVRVDGVGQHIRKGKALLEKHQDDDAVGEFTEALRLNPEEPAALAYRGLALVRGHLPEKAREDCDHALKLDPKSALAYAVRGAAYEWRHHEDAKEDWDKAAADCSEAVRLDPNMPLAYLHRCGVLCDLGKNDEALADAERAIALDPNAALGYAYRGLIHKCQGKADKAIEDCTDAIHRDPQCAWAYAWRAAAYSDDRRDEGIEDLTHAIHIDQKCAFFYYCRGLDYGYKGDHDKAIDDYTKAIRLDPGYVDPYVARGAAYHDKGADDKGVEDYKSAIRLDPKGPGAHNNLAIIYRQSDPDRALEECSEAIRVDPKYANAYFNRATLYGDKHQWDKAMEDCTEAIRLDPKMALAYNWRGRCYGELGQYDRSIADLTEAIRLAPKWSLPYTNRAVSYQRIGDVSRSDADFRKARELAK